MLRFSRIVMRRSKSDLAPKQFANLEKIYASAEHLLALINDILDLSKIEAGQMVVYPADFDLAPLIDDCLGIVAPLVQSARVRLIQQVEPGLPMIFSDSDKVRQILINLLSNAVKFTEAGSVLLLKNVCHPLITFVLAFTVFDLSATWAGVAVILAAQPTGVIAYLFAEDSETLSSTIGATVVLSTMVSIVSVSVVLYLLS